MDHEDHEYALKFGDLLLPSWEFRYLITILTFVNAYFSTWGAIWDVSDTLEHQLATHGKEFPIYLSQADKDCKMMIKELTALG